MQYKNGNGKPIELDKQYKLIDCFELLFDLNVEPETFSDKLDAGFELLELCQKEQTMLKIILTIDDTPHSGVVHKTKPDRETTIRIDAALDNTQKAFKNQGFSIQNAEITELKEI